MTELERNALLPAGLRDVLPNDAAFEAEMVERLVAFLAARGYDRVKPPLIEFEDGLLSGAGVAVAPQTFRLMDPVSQRMMGLRADITPQIARIAGSRLALAPRPLRLSYAGEVLRVRGSQLRPERQIVQVGAELIGSAAPTADAEIIVMAVEAPGHDGGDTCLVHTVHNRGSRCGHNNCRSCFLRMRRSYPGSTGKRSQQYRPLRIQRLQAT